MIDAGGSEYARRAGIQPIGTCVGVRSGVDAEVLRKHFVHVMNIDNADAAC